MQEIFSKEEIRDIIISVVVVSIVFAYPRFGNFLLYSFVIVIVAFLFHELAHKFVARKFSCHAFYKMWPMGLAMGLILMFIGFRFVAPGAVVINPYRFGRWGYKNRHITFVELGKIAAAGPAVNLFFAGFFYLIGGNIFSFMSFINGWLAFFNLLPVAPLDGQKIFGWKPWLWLVMIISAAGFSFPFIFS